MRTATAAAVLAVLAVLVVGGFGARQWSGETEDNCLRIHRVIVVGGEVIAATRGMAEQDYQEGVITRWQRDRAIERVDAQLVRWNAADCVTT